jgi:hypothetical protein
MALDHFQRFDDIRAAKCDHGADIAACLKTCLIGPELGQTIPVSESLVTIVGGLSGLVRRSGLVSVHARWSARPDIDCLDPFALGVARRHDRTAQCDATHKGH